MAWLEAVRQEFNTDESYRGRGSGRCDCSVGLKIGKDVFLLEFEGFECQSVREGVERNLDDVDFYLDMNRTEWKSMLQNIKKNGHAIAEFTLNAIDLNKEEGLAQAKHGDQYRQDLFVRYNQTMQFFFDASNGIDTSFGRQSGK